MQLPWDEHFREIVIPAWQAYRVAEQRLTEAVQAKDTSRIDRARYDALREAGAAVFYAHHFADVVLRARPRWLPREFKSLGEVRDWVATHCSMLRTAEPVSDVSLLGDVADALKHAILTRNLAEREVEENDAVLVVRSGYGQGRYGEGKYGGMEQVLVLAKSGTRALSSILQNVIDAWRRASGIELPTIGDS
jgi:hypothetical protein